MTKIRKIQRWSNIDIFGLLNGISTWDPQYRTLRYVRAPGETTQSLREKIFRIHDNPGDTTKQGIINGLSSELGLGTYNVISKTAFELTRYPQVAGASGVQDIWCYYKQPGESDYTEITQVWSENYTTAKNMGYGFIVWQDEHYNTIPDIKNFRYSRNLEVLKPLENNTEIKVIYYIESFDEYKKRSLHLFTDMDNPLDPDDKRFLYKTSEEPNISGDILAYTLSDLPSYISDNYYNSDGSAKQQIYNIKDIVNSKFRHKWKDLKEGTSIWDVHKHYGSGHIPSFYDAEIPVTNTSCATSEYLTGGVEHVSDSLYLYGFEETEVDNQIKWYPRIQPGKFYIDGVPFYLFYDHDEEYITFTGGISSLPSGISRGTHIIIAASGYYDDTCVEEYDTELSGIYEDYSYPLGTNGDSAWSNIYRRKHNWSTIGETTELDLGEYYIDFNNNQIIGSGITNAHIIWDKKLAPSGRLIQIDHNPMNDPDRSFENYFMYLTIDNE